MFILNFSYHVDYSTRDLLHYQSRDQNISVTIFVLLHLECSSDTNMSIPDEVMKKIKKKVFNQQNKYLVETLGDPSRYFPYMVSADILNFSDKEHIRSKITSKEKAETFIDILMQREEASAFDEFVEALLEERVQSHIARRLQQALKVEIDKLNIPPAAQTNATGKLITPQAPLN